jgi:hypothetical protein
LKGEHKLQAPTYQVPRKISGTSLFNNIRIVKSRKLRWIGKEPNIVMNVGIVDIYLMVEPSGKRLLGRTKMKREDVKIITGNCCWDGRWIKWPHITWSFCVSRF